MTIDKIAQLNDWINHARRIVFFGGAGVSVASGIPDFRSENGLYSNEYDGKSPEEILSATYFALNTKKFYDFYRKYMVHPEAQPNAVHKKLYELEKADKLRGIVTQNIDGLHKIAGNIRVYELHGNIHENYCVNCEESYPLEKIMDAGKLLAQGESDGVPRCDKCGGIIKPWVVLYGEVLDKYTGIGACREISNCDLLIVAGTSLSVEPAASYLEYFGGKHLVVINKDATPADDRADLVIREDVNWVFEQLG